MEVCPLKEFPIRLQKSAPMFLYQGCLLHKKSIPVPPWSKGTHGHSGRQHLSGILGVIDRSE